MKKKQLQMRNSTAEFLIFAAQSGKDSIEVRYEDETIWLTQKLMATLFAVTVPTINEHLKNIFASKELDEQSAIRKFRITAADEKQYNTQFYNLDGIRLFQSDFDKEIDRLEEEAKKVEKTTEETE